MFAFFRRRIQSPAGLFNGPFFDVRTLFVLEFDTLPSVSAIGDINGSAAYAFIWEQHRSEVVDSWQHSYFEYDDDAVVFARTILQLSRERLIEIGPNYVEVLHRHDFDWANGLLQSLASFRAVAKEAPIGFARRDSMN